MANTSRFVRPFLEFLFPEAAESTLQMYHFYIRKFAHLFEYAVLAIVSSRAFKSSSKRYLNGIWPIAALIAVLTIASIDEINQSLGTTRTGSIYDIFLDFVGGCIGVSTYFLTFKLWIGVMNPGGSENRLPES
jgi:VanZ family protein